MRATAIRTTRGLRSATARPTASSRAAPATGTISNANTVRRSRTGTPKGIETPAAETAAVTLFPGRSEPLPVWYLPG